MAVLNSSGSTITVGHGKVSIQDGGIVTVDGNEVATLKIVNFTEPQRLQKEGLYRLIWTGGPGAVQDVPAAHRALRAVIHKAAARILTDQLDEQNSQNPRGQLDFDLRLTEDDALRSAREEMLRARMPEINVSASEGKLLHLLARAIGARRCGCVTGWQWPWLAPGPDARSVRGRPARSVPPTPASTSSTCRAS